MSSIFRVEALPRCVVAALVFAAVLRVPHADALELPRARSVPGSVASYAGALRSVESVTAKDAHTVIVKTTTPNPMRHLKHTVFQ